MKICAVCVFYNPDETCVRNISSYSTVIERVYVIDNSNTDSRELLQDLPNVIYIPNMKNLGIAAALNIGCEKAYNDGFKWCMTMDQDSSWKKETIANFLYETEILIKENRKIVSIAPSLLLSKNQTSYIGDLKRKLRPVVRDSVKFKYTDRVITSGNIISLDSWNSIGRFNDSLFIDEVDSEFCYRLCEEGFDIVQYSDIEMEHILGTPRKTFFPRPENHHGVRLYYIVRNKLFVCKNYSYYARKYKYRNAVFSILIHNLVCFKFKDLFFVCMGIKDYLCHKLGEYHDK